MIDVIKALFLILQIAVGIGLIATALTLPGIQFLMSFGGGMLFGSGAANLGTILYHEWRNRQWLKNQM